MGIRPEHANRLFEPFFSTKSEKGTGLGLWISKGIVTKYEGAIRFRTLQLSGGAVTCFAVFLPAVATEGHGKDKHTEAAAPEARAAVSLERAG